MITVMFTSLWVVVDDIYYQLVISLIIVMSWSIVRVYIRGVLGDHVSFTVSGIGSADEATLP